MAIAKPTTVPQDFNTETTAPMIVFRAWDLLSESYAESYSMLLFLMTYGSSFFLPDSMLLYLFFPTENTAIYLLLGVISSSIQDIITKECVFVYAGWDFQPVSGLNFFRTKILQATPFCINWLLEPIVIQLGWSLKMLKMGQFQDGYSRATGMTT